MNKILLYISCTHTNMNKIILNISCMNINMFIVYFTTSCVHIKEKQHGIIPPRNNENANPDSFINESQSNYPNRCQRMVNSLPGHVHLQSIINRAYEIQ